MEASASGVVRADEVLRVLQESMAPAAEVRVRDAALRKLEFWQKERVPGVVTSLLDIVAERERFPPDLRLYAAIMVKNVVGCTWNRSASNTFGRSFVEKREWALISEEEKEAMKGRLLPLLFSEPEETVLAQLLVLVGGVARYDFPARWPDLVRELLRAAGQSEAEPPHQQHPTQLSPESLRQKLVALRCLKSVLRALKGKKSLVSVTNAEMLRNRDKLREFARLGSLEMKTLYSDAALCFPALYELWRRWSTVQGGGRAGWREAGAIANRALSCLRHTILVLDTFRGVQHVMDFFRQAAEQAAALKSVFAEPPAGSLAAGSAAEVSLWRELAAKSCTLINKCCIAAVDKHPKGFAPAVVPFLQVYVETIMHLDYHALQGVSQKRLVLMTRFLAKVFHAPAYKRGPVVLNLASAPGRPPQEVQQEEAEAQEVQLCRRAIGDFFESPIFAQLIEALITKFLLLTDEELEEWESDPEGFFLVSNLDLDIESEVRRCCAEALLLFLMERNIESTTRVVLSLAAEADKGPGADRQALRLTEACLHAIDATALLIPTGSLDYEAFIVNDLVKYLQMPSTDVVVRSLQGRILHLLVTVSSELQSEASYGHALKAGLEFLQSPDVVLALYGVKLLHKLCLADILRKGVKSVQEAQSALLRQHLGPMLGSSFQLASKLQDAETLQMALKLIAIEIEALTEQTNDTETVAMLATHVPQMWQTILALSEKEAGFGAPCQSSLINILLLLIEKVGDACLRANQLREVVFQLIGFCVNVGASHATYLLEDGLKLWRTVMLYGSEASISDSIQSSLGTLLGIIQAGKENHETLCILKVYVLLCGSEVIRGEREALVKLLVEHCLSEKGTVKEAFAALDFLYATTLVDPDLSYRLAQSAVPFLLQKVASKQLSRALLDPLLSLIALFVLWNGSLLDVFLSAGGSGGGGSDAMADELAKILLSFKSLRSVHEFLAVPGARAAGSLKRKVAVILLGFIAKYQPTRMAKYKDHVLQFGVSQVREEVQNSFSVEDLLDAKAGLTTGSEHAEVWGSSAFFAKAKEVFSRDPIYTLNLRELVGHTAEYILQAARENSDQQHVDALLTNIMGNMKV